MLLSINHSFHPHPLTWKAIAYTLEAVSISAALVVALFDSLAIILNIFGAANVATDKANVFGKQFRGRGAVEPRAADVELVEEEGEKTIRRTAEDG